MVPTFPHNDFTPDRYAAWLQQMNDLWRDMDHAYTMAAEAYGFACRGCEDNCCRTRFYHHTVLEYLSLYQGFKRLHDGLQQALKQRASAVAKYQARPDRDIDHPDHLCPLNKDGLCRLYAYRPMICRLHGLPHELHPGDDRVVHGPGCDVFVETCGNEPYIAFDRTPFYTRMAALEKGVRQEAPFQVKIKMTVAEMIGRFEIGSDG
jgi:Fe-S-cluster containining protein